MITIHVGYYKEEGRLGCSSIQQKCNYSMKKYVHLISGDGLKADPQKVVVAIMKMQKPTDIKSMQQFTEFVNCLAKFLPNLSTICEPLPKLSCKDTSYTWQSQHEATFKKIKQLATAAPALQFYVTKEITIQCDASSSGLGAVLMQDGHPRAYTSKALTATERNYAQNEKEYIYIYTYLYTYITEPWLQCVHIINLWKQHSRKHYCQQLNSYNACYGSYINITFKCSIKEVWRCI